MALGLAKPLDPFFAGALEADRSCRPLKRRYDFEQVKQLHHPDDYHDALASYYKALRTKAPVTLECRIVQPDGVVLMSLPMSSRSCSRMEALTQLRGTSQDITAYRNIEAALRDSEDHYRHMVELHPQIPWTAGPDGGVLEVGPKWYQLSGMTQEETLRYGWMTRVHPDDVARMIALREECVATGRPLDCECRIFLQDGRTGWFRSRAAARLNHQGQIVRWYGTLEDITDRHMAEAARRASEALAFRVLEATKDAVIVFDRSGHAKYANAQATSLFGSGAPLNNLCIDEIFPSGSTALFSRRPSIVAWKFGENSHSTFFCEFVNIWLEANIYADAENVSLFLRDISDKKRAEEQLNYAARHDSLTGTLNRGEFFARLQEIIARRRPENTRPCSVWTWTISRILMTSTATRSATGFCSRSSTRLSALLGPNDLLARAGGDEFMLAQAGIATEEEATDLAAHILRAMGGGFAINELVIAASMSIGVAMTARKTSRTSKPSISRLISRSTRARPMQRAIFAFSIPICRRNSIGCIGCGSI